MGEFDGFGDGLDFGPGSDTLPSTATPTQGVGNPASIGGGASGSGDGGDSQSPSPFFRPRVQPPQPTPNDPVQDQINALQAQRQVLQRRINNPLRQFLKPEVWQQELKQAGEIDQTLLKAKTQQQAQQDLRHGALQAGMDPDRVNTLGATASENTVLNAWTDQLNSGSFVAAQKFLGLGEQGQKVLAQQEGVYMPALAARNEQAHEIVSKLNTAASTGQPAYAAQLEQFRKQGVDVQKALSNYVPEFTLPTQADAWNVRGKGVQGALGVANQLVGKYEQKQAQLRMSEPISDEKVANAHLQSHFRGTYGDPVPGTSAITLPSGEVGAKMAPGSANPEKNYARSDSENYYSNESKEGVKALRDSVNDKQHEGALGDYKMTKKINDLAQHPETFKTGGGVASLTNGFSAIERDIPEGAKASGNVGIAKILEDKYGHVGSARNWAAKEWSEFAALLDGKTDPKEIADRLSPSTIAGLKDIIKFKYDQSRTEVSQRLGQPFALAGYQGIDLSHTGLDKELQNDPALRAEYERGRKAYIKDVMKHPYLVEGTSRIMLREDSKNGTRSSPLKDADAPSAVLPVPAQKPVATPGSSSPQPPAPTLDKKAAPIYSAIAGTINNTGGPNTPPTLDKKAAPIYNAVATTARNINGPDTPPSYTRNVAAVLTGAAHSESGYNADLTHDGGIGYGLFGHNGDRLANMRKFAGVGPDEPVPQQTQAAFAARELDAIAKHTPWVKQILDNPNATKEDLGKVQMYFERPKGSVTGGKFTPENGHNWSGRIAQIGKIIGDTASSAASVLPPVAAWRALPEGARTSIKDAAVEHAPAIGSTAGGIAGAGVGSAVAPGAGTVAGGVAGGAAGGAAGQTFKNWMQGKPLTENVGHEAALGGALSVVPEGRPVLGAAARILGAGGVEAGNEALDGGSASDVIKAGGKGGLLATAGEAGGQVINAVMKGLGKAGHMIASRFNEPTQQELVRDGEVIAKGKPEPPQAGPLGVTDAQKAAHDEALTAYEDAVQRTKDKGIDPDHLAYAVDQVAKEGGATKGEAVVSGTLERARKDLGKGFEAISDATGKAAPTATHGAPGAQKALKNGPTSIVRTADNPAGTVPEKFADKAADVEMQVTAPAKSWQQKWDQLHKVQSELLMAERDAAQSTAKGKSEEARAMRALADNVHGVQASIAEHVFGKDGARVVMQQYHALRREYAKLMDLEGGKGLIAKVAKNDAAGRATLAQFDKFAGNDAFAKMMVRRLAYAEKAGSSSITWPTVLLAQPLHAIPGVGTVAAVSVTAYKAQMAMRKWLVDRGAGKPAQLKDYFPGTVKKAAAGSQQVPATAAKVMAQ